VIFDPLARGELTESGNMADLSRREKLEEMLQTDPDDPFLHYALAKEHIAAGEAAAGLSRLQAVIERFPDYVAAYFQQAQVLAEQQQHDAARQALVSGIEVANRVGDAHAV